MLDEYDIVYEGISAFSSINKEELSYRERSLFEFLEQVNSPVEIETSVLSELNSVFEMYKNAINEQVAWTKEVQSHFNSLELDLLEISIDQSNKANERLEKMKDMFKTSHLNRQLRELNQLKEKMTQSIEEVFLSLQQDSN